MSSFNRWIAEYDLFLFDFDGLLVNTEYLHYKAYQKMCLDRGFPLTWDFFQYCGLAHMGSDFLQKALYKAFPDLYRQEPDWKVLHREKQKAFLSILSAEGVDLMPGVEKVLQDLDLHKVRCCVVTNSPLELTEAIKKQYPILQSIPYWVTREQYDQPKPKPDSYLKAIELYGKPGDRILGFEDTIRGWKALHAAGIEAVVISSLLTEEMKQSLRENRVDQYLSFEEVVS